MKRRHFIQTTGLSIAAVLLNNSLFGLSRFKNEQLLNLPDEVTAVVNDLTVKLTAQNGKWIYRDVIVTLLHTGSSIAVEIQAPDVKLSSVTLIWKVKGKGRSEILNDHWERTYGNISWHKPIEKEILPWYFMEFDGQNTTGFGVKKGCNTFCSWHIGTDSLSLNLDTLSGGDGVELGNRTLKAAEIVSIKSESVETPYETSRRFMKVMCEKARMPKQPVYGINDWYFTYGNTSEKLILEHTQMMAPMADGLENRPFSVIDAGWFLGPSWAPDDCCWGDNMSTPDRNFPDMGNLALKITKVGMRPGIWTRPLCGSEKSSASLMLPLIKGREIKYPVLDPTIPENLDKISNYFKLYNQWGYEMVKFDYTTFDIMGRWGFEMLQENSMTAAGWSMYDKSKTNAEVILNLYNTIREAAGETYIIGCNTISHLSAGIFELNRIGDDTSGNEWDRTRKMGVNTLAFRCLHQGIFYASDGDCVGLTNKVPWEKNKQWMELLARSGMPLFISAQREATGAEQKATIKESFKFASQNLTVAEPLDWMETPFPKKWKLDGEIVTFNWD